MRLRRLKNEDIATTPITTRQQAVDKGLVYFFTGEPCKRGHIQYRYTRNTGCIDCMYPIAQLSVRGDEGYNYTVTLKMPVMVPTLWLTGLNRALQISMEKYCRDIKLIPPLHPDDE